jgi:hypothetical protein
MEAREKNSGVVPMPHWDNQKNFWRFKSTSTTPKPRINFLNGIQ